MLTHPVETASLASVGLYLGSFDPLCYADAIERSLFAFATLREVLIVFHFSAPIFNCHVHASGQNCLT